MTAAQLSRALSPFRIRPHNARFGGAIDRVLKAYQIDQFADAFTRYLDPVPATGGSNRYTATSGGNTGENDDSEPLHAEPRSGYECHENTRETNGCSGVAVSEGEHGRQGDEKDEMEL